MYCAAFGCNNNSSKGARVSFFDFPKDKSLRKQWILKVKRKNWRPSRHARLCSEHFEEGAFVQSPSFPESLGLTAGKLRLRSIHTEARTRNEDDRRYVREIE